MNAWEIWTYDPGFGEHPAVIVSHQQRVTNKPTVEILICSSQRPSRPVKSSEVMLDTEDGMSWGTYCKCDLILAVEKEELHTKRGRVTVERQRQIVRTIVQCHGWNAL